MRYIRLPRLFEMLGVFYGDGSYPRLMNQLAKADLIILDDWGIQKIATAQRNDQMEVIEDLYGLKFTLIATRLPMEHWQEFIGEATLADAILDRHLHNAHRLPLSGESMRKSQTQFDRLTYKYDSSATPMGKPVTIAGMTGHLQRSTQTGIVSFSHY